MRFVLAVAIVLNVAAASGQDAKESVPPTVRTPLNDPSRVIYELDVSPADEPRPAMKYRLLPDPADLQPGNAATQYYKAFLLEGESPIRREAYRKLVGWMETPLRDLDIDHLGKTLESLHDKVFYDCIRAATLRAHCDWEESVEEEGARVRLPALSDLRSVARLVLMKAKYEIARGNYHEAMLLGRDNFTLSYHLQRDGEIVLQNLVGIAFVEMMHDGFFVEWIRSPNSPNLYWALAEIPPYFDSRQIISGDLRLPEYTLPGLKDIGRRPLTTDEAHQFALGAFSVENGSFRSKDDAVQRTALAAWALQAYQEGYQELIDAGYSKVLLDQMPVLQLALVARWQRYQHARDDLYKWAIVVHGPARELSLLRQNEIHNQTRVSTAPFSAFLPALGAMYQAQLRQHRYLSVLRTIEALRLHAARHGDFPKALADIREVPVPNDPVTNAPFVYRGRGKTATLTMVRHDLGADMEYEYRLRLREATTTPRSEGAQP